MKLNIVAFSIPLFIGFIALEYYITKKKRLGEFQLHNMIANISVGIAERLLDVFVAALFFYVYSNIQHRYGLFQIKPTMLLWLLLLIATDFVWYWYHRLGHEVNLLWALHVVHHQSEEFNYTVSARITSFQALARGCFWCVLPFIGFPASMITSVLLVHGLYPFFIHTKLIGKLGILEYLIVTPSHHRVHHASNEQYLDKNYGDVFIIWDKLFGTFKKEEDETEITYGLTKPLDTYSFLWQHFHFLVEILLAAKQEKSMIGKLKIIFGRPDSLSPTLRLKAEQIFNVKQNKSTTLERPLNTYVLWQISLLLISLFVFLLFEKNIPIFISIIYTTFTLLTLINCGAIMEQKRWVFSIEFARICLLLLIPIYQLQSNPIILVGGAIILLVTARYKYLQERYLQLLYRYSLI